MLKRKMYDRLLKWKNESQGRTALLVEGARRVGKSTIVSEFAKREYRSYLIIDFSRVSPDVRQIFFDCLENLDQLFSLLRSKYEVALYERESLIVFDEVQAFPKAREAIKALVEDGRYDYVETGSLISIKRNVRDIVIPSEEQAVRMHPLDFEEFCWAMQARQAFDESFAFFMAQKEVPPLLHKRMMMLFRQYMIIGGMPQVVSDFLDKGGDYVAADVRKRVILDLYRNDIRKIDDRYQSKVAAIYDQIPSFLSKHDKRVVIGSIAKGQSYERYEDTFFWLADSMICNECFNVSDPNIGLSLNEDRTYVKCYMADTGLLLSHAFDEEEVISEGLHMKILMDKLSLNEGMLYENAVAQMLAAKSHRLFYYVGYNAEKHRNDIEIDFLLSTGGRVNEKLIPIEVKSSKNYTTVSLDRFLSKFGTRAERAYVIHPKNLSVKNDRIVCLPPYMACFL